MIEWKRHCTEAQPLNPQQVRTILNMALSDVTQHRYHHVIRKAVMRTGPQSVSDVARADPFGARHHLQVVPDPPKRRTRWFVDTHVKVKSGLFRPDHVSGKIHFVDQLRSHLRWEVPGERVEPNLMPKEPTELYLYGWCGKHYKNPIIIKGQPEEEEAFCRGCLRIKREDGYPPSGRINFRGTNYARYWRPES